MEQSEKLLELGFIRPAIVPQVNPCSAFVVFDKASDGRGEENQELSTMTYNLMQ